MSNRLGGTLRVRLAVLIGILFASLSVALLTLGPRWLDANARETLIGRSVVAAQVLATACEAPVDFDDVGTAEMLLHKGTARQGALWAVLLRADGSRLAVVGDPRAQIESCVDPLACVTPEAGRVIVRVPVTGRASVRGTLAMAFDLSELETRRQTTLRRLLGASLAMLFIGLLIAWAIGTLAAQPLTAMTQVARRIAEGGSLSDIVVPRTTGAAESDLLGAAFSSMLTRLLAQQHQLLDANRQLEARLDELHAAQRQLVEADRRVSLGRLAAGAAHEINNPLAWMAASLDDVERRLEGLDQLHASGDAHDPKAGHALVAAVRESIAAHREGAQRIARIVRTLKAFSRVGDDDRTRISPLLPLEAAVEMVRHQLIHRGRLVTVLAATPDVVASESRLSQVFLNLLINAVQALPEGDASRHMVEITAATDASGWAVIAVRDTGCGMTPDVQRHLFTPFFTTKPVGSGTGLGLSISLATVRELGGEITFESSPDRGSTFRVRLPPAPEPDDTVGPPGVPRARPGAPLINPRGLEGEPAAGASSPSRTPGPKPVEGAAMRRGRVLVVDDEPFVGTFIARALGDDLDVTCLTSPVEALARVARGERFDVAVFDLMMPEMSGIELHAKLLEHVPDMKDRVLFVTGGAFTPATESFVNANADVVLEKPIDFRELRRRVHARLA